MLVKRVTTRFGRDFVCERCKQVDNGLVEPVEELCEKVETVRGFCYLGDRVNASDSCMAAVAERARIGWVKFKECGELLNSKSFLFKTNLRDGVSDLCNFGDVVWECRVRNSFSTTRAKFSPLSKRKGEWSQIAPWQRRME